MHDVLFIGMELWDEVWRRSQNLMACYARRFPERTVLFVALPVDVSYALRTRDGDILKSALHPVRPKPVEGFDNLYTVRPVKWLPDSLRGGRAFNQRMARAQVRRAMRLLGMTNPLLWIKPPWGAHYLGQMGECASLYDVGDDWTAITQSARAKRWAVDEDAYLTQHADRVIVVSDSLCEKKRQQRQDVFLVPNGVAAQRYAAVSQRTLTPHVKTEGWTRPVLGYTGMLHADRFDIELTLELARRFPQGTIALVGPNLLDGPRLEQLLAGANIRVAGPVPHHELPNVMTAFDVCIVPNRLNAFSESQNPLKLWEYLASDLPTVATPVSGFRDYPELVYLASDAITFAAAIETALSEPPECAAQRQAAVAGETWDARLDTVLKALRERDARP